MCLEAKRVILVIVEKLFPLLVLSFVSDYGGACYGLWVDEHVLDGEDSAVFVDRDGAMPCNLTTAVLQKSELFGVGNAGEVNLDGGLQFTLDVEFLLKFDARVADAVTLSCESAERGVHLLRYGGDGLFTKLCEVLLSNGNRAHIQASLK